MTVAKQRFMYVVTDYLSALSAVSVFTAIRFHVMEGMVTAYRSVSAFIKHPFRSGAGVRRIIVISDDDNTGLDGKSVDALLEKQGMRAIATINTSKGGNIRDDKMLKTVLSTDRVDGFMLNIHSDKHIVLLRLLDYLFRYELPIYVTPEGYGFAKPKAIRGTVRSESLIDLSRTDSPAYVLAMKRFSDILVSSLGLVVLTPVMLFFGLAVKLQSRGPAIYSQERIGYRKRPFNIYKLRSMYEGAEDDRPMLSGAGDSRVTPLGKFMRKYRIDELPNLWNVLRGDMSIVGPRPERKFFIDQILVSAPYYSLLHQVRPGLTSWGMVKYGYASSVDEMIERLRYDILYIENLSPSLDFKILFYTFRTLIKGEGI